MYCPKCGHKDTKVLDTRIGKSKLSIRRRRECLGCGYRFTTVEEILREGLIVIKRDGRREDFDRMKILDGLRKATEKRPIQAEQIEMMVAEVMEALDSEFDTEIPTKAIGEQIMNRLKAIDSIAYVRYASVYKDFRDINEFAREISSLKRTTR
ncbi:transcriptional repressor NrdR [Ruficoccus amylovorans]|uniref:Transcriptional repressor NrdR n=1 Tax=Ruficoccus amylovorans TaxID=1804625 RepID=A0A842H8L6_9BACT|nr:transcriptional regulator NrdR [Ruficoccus amylovorans]MBC2592873.1 transcriptional repressor NrdR [Ruficoccus amylovorans]